MKIYNTLNGKKETFTPIEPGKVRMYVCGMTVYDACHLGHGRVLVAFDVITRYLRHRGYDVTYVRNITDIDDKIIQRAQENGETHTELSTRFTDAMHRDCESLNVLPPDMEPKATEHMDDMWEMIQTLIDKGNAYVADNGDVYFSVRSFPKYGKLSGKVLDELEAGARVDVEEHKRDPLDFALWKAAKEDEPHWVSPWGAGRPGWHIECSAMTHTCLGKHFDIHGGGPDLKFPHHENEIAQSEAAHNCTYANTWMHAGALRLDGEKMSKSLGNFFTIADVLEKYPAETIRFFLLSSQYRSAINFSDASLNDAQTKLERFYRALEGCDAADINASDLLADDPVNQRFYAAMDDDFNTPEAIAVLFDLVRDINKAEGERKQQLATQLRQLGQILGCLQLASEDFLQSKGDQSVDVEYIEAQIERRLQAKRDKDFATADTVRDELLAKNIVLKDGPDGTTWSIRS